MLASVDNVAVTENDILGLAVLIACLSVIACINSSNSIYIGICLTEHGCPSALGVTVHADSIVIEGVFIMLRCGEITNISHCRGIYARVIEVMYRIGSVISGYTVRIVTVKVSVMIGASHGNVSVIKGNSCISVKNESVKLRTVRLLRSACEMLARAGKHHNRNVTYRRGGIDYMHIEVKVERSAVGLNAILYLLCLSVADLDVFTVRISLAVSIEPNGI